MRPCLLAGFRHKHNWPTITPFILLTKIPSTRYLLQPPQRVKARLRGCPLPPLSPHPQILQHHIHYNTNHAPINDRQETIHQVPSPASRQKMSPEKHIHQIPIKYPTYLHTSYPKRQSTTSQTGYTMRTHPHNGPPGHSSHLTPPTQATIWTLTLNIFVPPSYTQ